jgi:hypothetical protein
VRVLNAGVAERKISAWLGGSILGLVFPMHLFVWLTPSFQFRLKRPFSVAPLGHYFLVQRMFQTLPSNT